jgi:hypothetical protein
LKNHKAFGISVLTTRKESGADQRQERIKKKKDPPLQKAQGWATLRVSCGFDGVELGEHEGKTRVLRATKSRCGASKYEMMVSSEVL